MTLNEVKDLATVLAVGIAVLSLAVTGFNSWMNARTNRARFWLDLRAQFAKHDVVHRHLRPGGQWANGGGPETPEDWAMVEAYMGLFEHCEIMLSQRLIDAKAFREIYAYRLKNIVANDVIRHGKLVQEAPAWQRFLALLQRMEIALQDASDNK